MKHEVNDVQRKYSCLYKAPGCIGHSLYLSTKISFYNTQNCFISPLFDIGNVFIWLFDVGILMFSCLSWFIFNPFKWCPLRPWAFTRLVSLSTSLASVSMIFLHFLRSLLIVVLSSSTFLSKSSFRCRSESIWRCNSPIFISSCRISHSDPVSRFASCTASLGSLAVNCCFNCKKCYPIIML